MHQLIKPVYCFSGFLVWEEQLLMAKTANSLTLTCWTDCVRRMCWILLSAKIADQWGSNWFNPLSENGLLICRRKLGSLSLSFAISICKANRNARNQTLALDVIGSIQFQVFRTLVSEGYTLKVVTRPCSIFRMPAFQAFKSPTLYLNES